jgi:hypothetical protein
MDEVKGERATKQSREAELLLSDTPVIFSLCFFPAAHERRGSHLIGACRVSPFAF